MPSTKKNSMKNSFKSLLFVTIILLSVSGINAQGKKNGHINSNDLLLLMPERKEAETKIQDEAKKLEQQLSTMTAEYQTKVADYQTNSATMTDLIKQTKAKEIQDLEQRIQDFQQNAQESLQKKEQELLKPIIDKAKKAIEDVAKEGGFGYVFDTSAGVLLFSPEGDNIMPLVKKKLGLAEK